MTIVTLQAAFFYALGMFALGCLLGPLRVLFIEPQVGPLNALFVEGPLLIAGMFNIAPRVLARWPVAPEVLPRLTMGAIALGVLLVFELGLGLQLGRTTLEGFLNQWSSPEGMVSGGFSLIFALIPLILIGSKASQTPE